MCKEDGCLAQSGLDSIFSYVLERISRAYTVHIPYRYLYYAGCHSVVM